MYASSIVKSIPWKLLKSRISKVWSRHFAMTLPQRSIENKTHVLMEQVVIGWRTWAFQCEVFPAGKTYAMSRTDPLSRTLSFIAIGLGKAIVQFNQLIPPNRVVKWIWCIFLYIRSKPMSAATGGFSPRNGSLSASKLSSQGSFSLQISSH